MNEIEKLMQNVGVKPVCLIPDKYCGMQPIYEDLTPEKQLELIKWLAKNKNDFGLTFYDNFGFGIEPQWECGCEFSYECFDNTFQNVDFEQSLAGLINNLWQDLTDTEKTRIKNILEM